jgi:hypothetical protein
LLQARLTFLRANTYQPARFASEKSLKSCQGCQQLAFTILGIPLCYWLKAFDNANGYFGSEGKYDEEGRFVGQSKLFPNDPEVVR